MANKYNIEEIAKGKQEVNVSELSPIEALQIGLQVRQYQEDNGLLEKEVTIDYNAVGEFFKRK